MSGTTTGRPRSEKSRTAILEATIELLLEGGYSRLTLEGIASRAGVGRQTLYRWWASKDEIVAESITDGRMLPAELPIPDTGDIEADLTQWLTEFAQGLDEEHAAARARLLTAATAESALVAQAFNQKVAGPYRQELAQRLQQAVDSGELRPDAPVHVVADALMGATLYSVFLRSPASEPTALLAGVLLDGIRQAH
ncbi:TetR/AcrR family transcriptional regulator [Microbacterium sp. P5_E9]